MNASAGRPSVRRPRMIVGALALSGATVAGLSGSALAATHAHTDPARDVVTIAASGKPTSVTGDQGTDIVRFRTDYTSTALALTVTTRGALPTDDVRAVGEFRTADGKTWTVGYAISGTRHGVRLFDFSDKRVACPGLTFTVTHGRTRSEATVPTSCFTGSATVRTGFGLITHLANSGSTQAPHIDDAQRKGFSGEDDLVLGPKVAKG